jgi:two-component system, NarL family, response regulator LiaR
MERRLPITVILADDHEVTRMGLRDLLQATPDIELVGEAADGDAARQLIAELQPHVALLDLVMPGAAPADITLWAAQTHPQTAVLALTGHDRDYVLVHMLDAGAVGYLDKNVRGEALLDAIRRAASGEILFTQEQHRRKQDWCENVQVVWEKLTPRERAVLELLPQGWSNRQMAAHLQVVEKTVEKHVGAILDKLGVASRTEAVLWLLRSGLDKACGMVGETPR